MAVAPHQKARAGKSVWTTPMPRFSPLTRDTTADVCVVGAGIAGLSTAYALARQGVRVAVVEAGRIGQGETGCTTAHLVSELDRRYYELIRYHGKFGVELIAASHRAAINRIQVISERESIACDFERMDGHLVGAGQDAGAILERELRAVHWIGMNDVELLEHCPSPAFHNNPCLRFPSQAQFHPLKYLKGLALAINRNGGRIFTNSRVKEISGGKDASVVSEKGKRVKADFVAVTTNTPINNMVVIHTKQAAYRSYVVGLKLAAESAFKGLFWDTEEPFHYVRCHAMSSKNNGQSQAVLIVGGEDHKTGQGGRPEEERFQRLEAWARERFPQSGETAYRWSGQIMESNDGIAFIGRNPGDEDNVFIATGDSGVGMTHGTIAGMLLSDLILGRGNPWTTVYDPSRKRGAWEFMKENANVALQYFDWLIGGDVESADDIARDSGAVVRRGLSKVAVYRDPEGKLHEMSASCPHLGCVVSWNSAERSWDCPCHGSRFDARGKLLNGPALTDLSPPTREKE